MVYFLILVNLIELYHYQNNNLFLSFVFFLVYSYFLLFFSILLLFLLCKKVFISFCTSQLKNI
ncbi:putative membrane protein [Acanthamoeba castellanii mamavirus]|nr:putative membrane protein [Acanthamoeba castellanii mamavirus]